MYQIITINWDISKQLKKLSRAVSVKIIALITLSERKLSEKKSFSLPWSSFYCCYLQKGFTHFPHKLIFLSLEISPIFSSLKIPWKGMNIFVWMLLKLPLATVMKVKSAVIWRKTNKLIQRYHAFELKKFFMKSTVLSS